MPRSPRISRAQVVALPRPSPALESEWLAAGIALALLLLALLAP